VFSTLPWRRFGCRAAELGASALSGFDAILTEAIHSLVDAERYDFGFLRRLIALAWFERLDQSPVSDQASPVRFQERTCLASPLPSKSAPIFAQEKRARGVQYAVQPAWTILERF